MNQRASGLGDYIFESPEVSIAGWGVCHRIEIDYSDRSLSLALDDLNRLLKILNRKPPSENPGVVALIAVPFTCTKPIVCIIPEKVEVSSRSLLAGENSIRSVESMPNVEEIKSARTKDQWCESVEKLLSRIDNSEIQKAVLARAIEVRGDSDWSIASIIRSLAHIFPSAYKYVFEGFVGASPELLVEKFDIAIRSLPLAGTTAALSDATKDHTARQQLLASEKNLLEHRLLAEMVCTTLEPFLSTLSSSKQPEVLTLPNVHHLLTRVSGELKDSKTSLLELVAALHPTPAVAGRPTKDAMSAIAELEELDRGYYGGAIGWIDASNNGQFAVAIRCAEIRNETARLFAGNGIVKGSIPEQEFTETQWKLNAMLSVLSNSSSLTV